MAQLFTIFNGFMAGDSSLAPADRSKVIGCAHLNNMVASLQAALWKYLLPQC